MYSELLNEFHGQQVVDYKDSDSWLGPDFVYRFRVDYDDEISLSDQVESLAEQPDHKSLKGLIVGSWQGACEGDNSQEIVGCLVSVAPQLTSLKHLFFGEMTSEECELSWINQSDVSPLLNAFPKLETLRVRGGNGLSLSQIRHEHLQELAIETGGLSRTTLRELFACEFPNLKRLELLLGEGNYGFDGGVEDLQPLLSGGLFPRLTALGLMNSVITNDIAAVVVNSPVVERLESLDLSMGNLDDEGARSLLGLAAYPNLKLLNISYHYASEVAIAVLKKQLACNVIAEDPQQPDDEWRPILHAE